jgi:hypothetical protein
MSIRSGVFMTPRTNLRVRRGSESTPAAITPVSTSMPDEEADHARAPAITESIVMNRSVAGRCDISGARLNPGNCALQGATPEADLEPACGRQTRVRTPQGVTNALPRCWPRRQQGDTVAVAARVFCSCSFYLEPLAILVAPQHRDDKVKSDDLQLVSTVLPLVPQEPFQRQCKELQISTQMGPGQGLLPTSVHLGDRHWQLLAGCPGMVGLIGGHEHVSGILHGQLGRRKPACEGTKESGPVMGGHRVEPCNPCVIWRGQLTLLLVVGPVINRVLSKPT